MGDVKKYKSIFAPSTSEERKQNFISYWAFSQQHSGTLFEGDKDLETKRTKLKSFQNKVISRVVFWLLNLTVSHFNY